MKVKERRLFEFVAPPHRTGLGDVVERRFVYDANSHFKSEYIVLSADSSLTPRKPDHD